MGCTDCGKATTITNSKPYRKPVRIPFGSDLGIVIQGIRYELPFDWDNVQLKMEVYDYDMDVSNCEQGEPKPIFTFGNSRFIRSQSQTAKDDVDVTWNDMVTFHEPLIGTMLPKLCYDVEYPFIITATDPALAQTYTRWKSSIIRLSHE